MENRIVNVKKSKLQLAAAVVFGLMSVNYFIDYLYMMFNANMLGRSIVLYRNFFDLFLCTMLFLFSLLLYLSKLSNKITALLGIAIAIRIFYIIRTMYFSSIRDDSNSYNSLWNTVKDYLPKAILIIAWIALLLTIFGILKTRFPALLCSAATLLVALITLISYSIDYFIVDYDTYHDMVSNSFNISYIFDIVLWVAVCFLVFTFPKSKTESIENNIPEILPDVSRQEPEQNNDVIK